MANNCSYDMKIVGKKEDCDEWVRRMNDYSVKNHFYRIFEADVFGEEIYADGSHATYICGDCAWSLESCCRASGYSGRVDLFAENTKELNIDMEAWSSEIGMGFQEHYIYKHGECIADECVDYYVYFWDESEYETYEAFKKDYEDAPPEEEFDDNGFARIGGFKDRYYLNWSI